MGLNFFVLTLYSCQINTYNPFSEMYNEKTCKYFKHYKHFLHSFSTQEVVYSNAQ